MPTGNSQLYRVFQTNPERLYQAFLDADAIAKWLHLTGSRAKITR
ncbi:hypothetical protein BCL69_10698 [Nitrosomonas communis]|uniref:Activator of Hsp90 ATPase homolog 1-like protein n=1 Tax=Nitrosomonas communis TaxID=44574 RepID=A0A5D3YCI5_9PROT|nr:hypothetical protein BCL69_10698 [Nitrosomonas communis]